MKRCGRVMMGGQGLGGYVAQGPNKSGPAQRDRFCCPEGLELLQKLHVLSLPALGSLHDVKLNGLALLQAAEALRLDSGEVNEHIFAVLAGDKTIPLGV